MLNSDLNLTPKIECYVNSQGLYLISIQQDLIRSLWNHATDIDMNTNRKITGFVMNLTKERLLGKSNNR